MKELWVYACFKMSILALRRLEILLSLGVLALERSMQVTQAVKYLC